MTTSVPTAPAAHKATPEQRAIIAAAKRGESMRIQGLAGAAKTSTLRAIAYALKDRGLTGYYLAFNKPIADSARAKFPPWIKVMTQHSLAFRAVGFAYKHRLHSEGAGFRLRKAIADEFNPTLMQLTWNRFAALQSVLKSLNNFLCSADPHVLSSHVALADLREACIDPEEGRAALVQIVQSVFDRMSDPSSEFPITHDLYLKVFQLRKPNIGADVILFDEAQDGNPLNVAVVLHQPCQKIIVGDQNQAIYSFRGAIDAFKLIDFPVYPLTQSWRFGPAIAEIGNLILEAKGEPLRLVGCPTRESRLGRLPIPDVVLARTNAGLFAEAAELVRKIEPAEKIAFNKGVEPVIDMVLAAYHLFKHGSCDHPVFRTFSSWAELCQLAEMKQADNLGPFVKLILQYKHEIPSVCAAIASRATNNENEARVVLSTVHTYKGREAPTVRLADDFGPFCEMDRETRTFKFNEEEANVAYVAVTRAMSVLDLGSYRNVLAESISCVSRMREARQQLEPMAIET